MLLTTQEAVYQLHEVGNTPDVLLECPGVRCVAEGRRLSAVAFRNGRVALLEAGRVRFLDPDLSEGEHITALLMLAEDPVEMLVGAEPPHLYRLSEAGKAGPCGSFGALHMRSGWHTPWGGPPAVRSLAAAGRYVYANIHVGRIVVSPDDGATWHSAGNDVEEDVHQVVTCPAAPDRVYANTARAVFVSYDRGQSWDDRGKGLGRRYGRAIAVHPQRPNVLLASASDGPIGDDVHGQLYRTTDAGKTWSQVDDGFPSVVRANIDTGHVAVTADGTGYAAVGRTLYAGPPAGGPWRRLWEAPDEIGMLSVAHLA